MGSPGTTDILPPDPLPAASAAAEVEARVGEILDWLARPASVDSQRELEATRERLAVFSQLPLSINQFHRILDLLQSRVDLHTARFKQQVHDSGQRLTREVLVLAQELDQLQDQVFKGYERVLKDIEHRLVRNRRRDPGTVAARGLKTLRERLELAAYVARPAPQGLWLQTHRLYRICHGYDAPAGPVQGGLGEAGRIYRAMLAFAATQPERLSAEEVAGTADYLARFAPAVVILDSAPVLPDYHLFWADVAGDSPPVAVARKLPTPGTEVLHFSCTRLGTLAAEQVRELETGTAPEQLQLPPEAAQAAYHGLLHRLHEAWSEPPTRHLPRRSQSHRVSMVVGLAALAELFRSDSEGGARPQGTSEWTMVNESPSGCALSYSSGDLSGIKTGEAVAVRSGPEATWDVCVVRRVLNEGAGECEAGLQIIATHSSARVVRVAFRHTAAPQDTITGLWLPPVPALRSNNAILIPSGGRVSQRFVMVADDGHIHVIQGRVVEVGLLTASIELLEFEDDPYPL